VWISPETKLHSHKNGTQAESLAAVLSFVALSTQYTPVVHHLFDLNAITMCSKYIDINFDLKASAYALDRIAGMIYLSADLDPEIGDPLPTEIGSVMMVSLPP
jgi:hypothetical protein